VDDRLTMSQQCALVCQFGLAKCQVPTKTALSLPLLSWTEERKYDERLEGRDKDRERSLTSYCHGQNKLNLGRKGSLIHNQSNQRRTVRNKSRSSNTFSPFLPSSRAQLHSCFSPSSPRAAASSSGGRTPHTLPLLQREGFSHGRQFSTNFSNVSPSQGLQLFTNCPSVGPFPQGAVLQEQAAPAWIPHGVTSPASKSALAWAPLSRGLQVLPGAFSSMGLPMGSQPPSGIHLLQRGVPSTGCRWISAPPWTSMGCRGTTCLTMVFITSCKGRVSALASRAPPPPPSSLTLVSAELFLSHRLILLS